MNVIDYKDMPLKDLIKWLGHIRKDIDTTEGGFANVKALKLGCIDSVVKRLNGQSTATKDAIEDAIKSLSATLPQIETESK